MGKIFEEPKFEVIILNGRDVMANDSTRNCTAQAGEEEVDW